MSWMIIISKSFRTTPTLLPPTPTPPPSPPPHLFTITHRCIYWNLLICFLHFCFPFLLLHWDMFNMVQSVSSFSIFASTHPSLRLEPQEMTFSMNEDRWKCLFLSAEDFIFVKTHQGLGVKESTLGKLSLSPSHGFLYLSCTFCLFIFHPVFSSIFWQNTPSGCVVEKWKILVPDWFHQIVFFSRAF